jgi:hypothetical protein
MSYKIEGIFVEIVYKVAEGAGSNLLDLLSKTAIISDSYFVAQRSVLMAWKMLL